MNHIYLRVSTDHQDAENQKTGILAYLNAHGQTHVMLHTDTASGATTWRERGLFDLLRETEPGDSIVVSEVSRIGRSTVDVLDYFREATARGVKTIVTKSGMIVDDSLQSKITTTMLALAGEIEREFLLARTAEGYARARAAGVRVGRPPGATSPSKINNKANEIDAMLKAGVAKTAIARLLNVSRGTIDRFISRNLTSKKDAQP
jgi:DNA invertase Pin-like site-specific DNA recombinase